MDARGNQQKGRGRLKVHDPMDLRQKLGYRIGTQALEDSAS